MTRKIDLVLAGITDVRQDMRALTGRVDQLTLRTDTIIESLVDLRRDFDRHDHD